jgi:phosphoglycolate phosphatase-like HAD superfamily hydrolase
MNFIPDNIKAIGFDWDGTLVDSMGAKTEAFSRATMRYYDIGDRLEKLKQIYISTRGNSRFYQLGIVQKELGLPELSKEQLQEWSDSFTSFYINNGLRLFPGTIETLDLAKKGHRLFLNSSVPQDDLTRTLTMYPLDGYFDIILGNKGDFRKGLPHLSYVAKQFGFNLGQIAFVGDASDDVSGAMEAGCFTVGIADPRIEDAKEKMTERKPDILIKDIAELKHYLKP